MNKAWVLFRGFPFLGLILLVAPYALLAGRLPDPLASLWSQGRVEGSAETTDLLLTFIGSWATLWIVLELWRQKGGLPPAVAAGLYMGFGVIQAASLFIIIRNFGEATWSNVDGSSRLALWLVLLLGGGFATAAFFLHKSAEMESADSPEGELE